MATTRKYELKQRAERQEETRRRIVDAAVELHTTLGPARTSVAAIAERAEVTRPTVYAHFPDADALFQACSGHVRATVPLPDLDLLRSIEDPAERLEATLRALYAYYERLEPLLDNIQRDLPVMPVLQRINVDRAAYFEALRELLLAGRPVRGRARVRLRAALGHAIDFTTWQSLVRGQRCTTREAVELMCEFVRTAAALR